MDEHVLCQDTFDQGRDGFVFDSADRFKLGKSFVIRAKRNFRVFSGFFFFEYIHPEYRFDPGSSNEMVVILTFLCSHIFARISIINFLL